MLSSNGGNPTKPLQTSPCQHCDIWPQVISGGSRATTFQRKNNGYLRCRLGESGLFAPRLASAGRPETKALFDIKYYEIPFYYLGTRKKALLFV
jgi:hypothetical protein